MAEEMFSRADLEYIYRDILGHEGASRKDVDKLMKGLPAKFTIGQLQGALGKSGLGTKGASRFQQALDYMNNAVANPQPAPTTTQTPTGTQPRNTNYGDDSRIYTEPEGNKIRLNDYLPGAGPIEQNLSDLFLGGGRGGRRGGYDGSGIMGGQGGDNDIMSMLFGGQGGQRGGGAPWENAPFAAPPSFAENYIQQLLTGYKPTGPSALESSLSNMAMRGPQGLTPAASEFEGMMQTMASNPYLTSIAQGQIPQVMQDALNNQLRVSQANTLEGMGAGQGQLSSDLAQYLNRTENDARTGFLSNMAQMAGDVNAQLANIAQGGGGLYNQRQGIGAQLFPELMGMGLNAEQGRRGQDLQYLLGLTNPLLQTQSGANENALTRFLGTLENSATRGFNRGENAANRYMGLGSMLFGGEQGSRENAINRMFQEYGAGKGLDPGIGALLQLIGSSGGTTKTTGSQRQSGGGFQDLMGALGGLGGSLLTGGMFGMGPLSGLLGGGKKGGGGDLVGSLFG